jgi:hypothetical protein
MDHISHQEKNQAEKELQDAFEKLQGKRGYLRTTNEAKLEYRGMPSAKSKYSSLIRDIDSLLRYAEDKNFECDKYVIQSCPAFYDAIKNSPAQWSEQAQLEAEKVLERIQIAVKNIDDYALRRSKEIADSWMEELKKLPTQIERFSQQPAVEGQRYFNKISHDGLGRPWGTEIRQRIAIAAGIKQDVNNIWEVGLNSIANSASINLGPRFIELIIKDPAMEKFITDIEAQIIKDIKFRAIKAPYISPQNLDNRLSGKTRTYGLGGERNRANMFEQLRFTVLNPKQSLKKYADTWNVGFNELTWTIRNCSIHFTGVYNAVYNAYGFAFTWEMELSIEDSYDLRPRSGGKLNFDTPYNAVTSILGTVYHDWLGNTDKMKIRAKWNASGNGDNKIHRW